MESTRPGKAEGGDIVCSCGRSQAGVRAHRLQRSDWSGHQDPNGGVCFNISKETTKKEVLDIKGIPADVYRMKNMLLSAGHVNAVEYCTAMFKYPELTELLKLYKESKCTPELTLA